MLCDNLKRLREAKGLTQKQLAEAIDVVSLTISQWETGRRTPHIPTLRRLADTLGTTIDELTADPPTEAIKPATSTKKRKGKSS